MSSDDISPQQLRELLDKLTEVCEQATELRHTIETRMMQSARENRSVASDIERRKPPRKKR